MSLPIKCTVCQEPASIFCSSIINNKLTETCLCQKHGIDAGFLDSKAYSFLEKKHLPDTLLEGLSCVQCKTTFASVKKNNRFGCAQCYSIFADYIEGILVNLQKDNFHAGKIPMNALNLADVQKRVQSLEFELDLLVQKEQFEDAALIRDLIINFKTLIDQLIAKKTYRNL